MDKSSDTWKKLDERVTYLEEVNRYTIDALDQAVKFLDFNMYDRLVGKKSDITALFADMEHKVRLIIPVDHMMFALVDEDFDLDISWKSSEGTLLEDELSIMIDNGFFSWAIDRRKAVFASSQEKGKSIIMHVIATSSRVKGMFIANIDNKDMENLPEVSLSLLTMILLICANAIESLELYQLASANNVRLRKEVERRLHQLSHQAEHDGLTGLPNRDYIMHQLGTILRDMSAEVSNILYASISLNRFKDVNDVFGHSTGDSVLREVAFRLRQTARSGDVVARVGGDEFCLILPGVSEAEAISVGERYLQEIEKTYEIENKYIDISATFGMVLFPHHSEDPYDLVRKSELAIRSAKETQQKIAVYSPDCESSTMINVVLAGELKQAISSKGLYTVYQPKMDLHTYSLYGVETLVRWQHATQGAISPGTFIPIAEKNGLITKMTKRILHEALKTLKVWNDRGLDISVGINLSAMDIQDGNLINHILDTLASEDVPHKFIDFEITESALMYDPETAMKNIQKLYALGVTLSLDDFGTGYSSLKYLHMFPVHTIKIDLSFIRTMMYNQENKKIVKAIINLGKSLDKKTIAEGVEDWETLQELKNMGCDCVQGYYVGKPMKFDEIDAVLTEGNKSGVSAYSTGP